MTQDARFEDGAERPLRLLAHEAGDLPVLSALVQDAVFTSGDLRWDRQRRRLVLLVNRFRWEDRAAAEAARRPYERVRALLTVEDVTTVRSLGFNKAAKDLILSILSLDWTAGEDGTGHLTLTLSGDGALQIAAEALNVSLTDVTRPYAAPSGKAPDHGA